MQKKEGDGVMSANYEVIVIFQIHGQFGAIWRPYSGKSRFSLKVTFYFTKTENKT